MKLLQNLSDVTLKEQTEFFSSFQHVICDMDGVIWVKFVPEKGAVECIKDLQKINKNITFITNNSMVSKETITSKLAENGFDHSLDVYNPLIAIIEFLKNIKFSKKIFAMATTDFKEELKKAGFTLAPEPPPIIEENIEALLANVRDDTEVGAVICDVEFNITRVKLQRALTYLKRDDCLFIIGTCSKLTPPYDKMLDPIIGDAYFTQIIIDISGKRYLQLAKPSYDFVEIIEKKFNIKNPKTALVIGDSIELDMELAAAADYQKLLVLSGSTNISDILNWKYSERAKPQYYVQNLNVLKDILRKVYRI